MGNSFVVGSNSSVATIMKTFNIKFTTPTNAGGSNSVWDKLLSGNNFSIDNATQDYIAALRGKASGNVLHAQNMTPAQLATTIKETQSGISTGQDNINKIAKGQDLSGDLKTKHEAYQTARSKIEQTGGQSVQAALQQIDAINARIIELQNQQALTGASASVSQAAGNEDGMFAGGQLRTLANAQNNAANSIQQEITALEQQRAALEAQIQNSVGENDYKAYAEARDAFGSASAEKINDIRESMMNSQMDLSAAQIKQNRQNYVTAQKSTLGNIRSTSSNNTNTSNSATINIINNLAKDMVAKGQATSFEEACNKIKSQMDQASA